MRKLFPKLLVYSTAFLMIFFWLAPMAIKQAITYAVSYYGYGDLNVENLHISWLEGKLKIEDLKFSREENEQITFKQVTVDLSLPSLIDRHIHLQNITIEQCHTQIRWQEKTLRFAGFPIFSGQNQTKNQSEGTSDFAWKVSISQLQLQSSEFRFLTPAHAALWKINKMKLNHWTSDKNEKQTNLLIEGDLDDMPYSLSYFGFPSSFQQNQNLNFELENWDLEKVHNLVSQFDLKMPMSGVLSTSAQITASQISPSTWKLEGKTQGDASNIAMNISGKKLSLGQARWQLHIPELKQVESLQAFVNLDLNDLDFQGVESEGKSQGLQAKSLILKNFFLNSREPLLAMQLDRLQIDNLQPQQRPSLSNKTEPSDSRLLLQKVSLKKTKTFIKAQGQLGQHGTFVFEKKDLNHADSNEAKINLKLLAIDLTDFGSLLANQIGYEASQGQIDANMEAKANPSGELKGDLSVILRSLRLRDKNQQGQSFTRKINAPLGTSLKLIEDSEEKIDLNFTLKGNLDNPKFSPLMFLTETFAKLILEEVALQAGNALVTTYLPMLATSVMSPAMAYALVVKGYDFATKLRLEPLQFKAVSLDLTTAGIQQLAKVGKIMQEKPQVSLKFCIAANRQELWQHQYGTGKPQPNNLKPMTKPALKLAKQRLQMIQTRLIDDFHVKPKQVILCQPKIDEENHGGQVNIAA